jgi:hypothetical protein
MLTLFEKSISSFLKLGYFQNCEIVGQIRFRKFFYKTEFKLNLIIFIISNLIFEKDNQNTYLKLIIYIVCKLKVSIESLNHSILYDHIYSTLYQNILISKKRESLDS